MEWGISLSRENFANNEPTLAFSANNFASSQIYVWSSLNYNNNNRIYLKWVIYNN